MRFLAGLYAQLWVIQTLALRETRPAPGVIAAGDEPGGEQIVRIALRTAPDRTTERAADLSALINRANATRAKDDEA
mgnify:CR=1 FL=1